MPSIVIACEGHLCPTNTTASFPLYHSILPPLSVRSPLCLAELAATACLELVVPLCSAGFCPSVCNAGTSRQGGVSRLARRSAQSALSLP